MNDFLVCSNPECHMILDRRMDGESLDGARQIVKTCPECGSAWSLKPTPAATVLQQVVMARTV